MDKKIAIIGDGNVGQALADGLHRAGHEIRFGTTDPSQPVREAAEWADVIILAVPWKAASDVTQKIGNAADGKVVIDAINPLDPSRQDLAVGFSTSAAEEVQKMLPKAKVIKAFNTIFAQHMHTGKINGDRLTAYVAGDDADSKKIVMKLAEDIGFEAVDAGPLTTARYLEPEAMLHIFLAYKMGMGPNFGEKMVHQ